MDIDELFNRACQNFPHAEKRLFEYLFDSFCLFVQKRVRNKEDCEDIVQNSLQVILKKYKTVELKHNYAAWAYKILQHKIMDYYKSLKIKRKNLSQSDLQLSRDISTRVNFDLKERLLKCLEKISKKNIRFARIINLNYQGYSTNEICDKLNIEKGYFYVILSRAKSLLDICIEKGDIK